jgi:hypothetical protein
MIRFVVAVMLVACGPGAPGGPMNGKMSGPDVTPPTSEVVSQDILGREPLSNKAKVKHILISWNALADAFNGRQDQRAQHRSKADAEKDVKAVLARLKGGEEFDKVMKEMSEDQGSALSAQAYTVEPGSAFVIEFRQLSLRLRLEEIGVCQSEFGFHIIKRFE